MAKISSSRFKSRFLKIVLWSIAIALLGLSLSSAPWYKLWLFEILGAGYLWFAALTLVLFVGLLCSRPHPLRRHLSPLLLTLAIASIVYSTSILSSYIPQIFDSRPGGTPIAAMTYNVNDRYWDAASVAEVVRSQPADIFGLIEPFPDQATQLHALVRDLYPYLELATDGQLSLFSRYPISEATTENFQTSSSSLLATLDIQGKPVRVAIVHPILPIPPKRFRQRNQTLRALADYAKQYPSRAIVMGDFNTTSRSIYFRDFRRRSGFRNASLGHGIHPTWFYLDSTHFDSFIDFVLQLAKIPIDHIVVSPNIRVDRVTTVSTGISDHRPLIAELRIP